MKQETRRGRGAAAFVAGLLALAARQPSALAQGCPSYQEVGGLLVIEVESAPPAGSWVSETVHAGYTGASYYRWSGPDQFSSPGQGILRYDFEIQTPGTYRLALHNRHDHPDATLQNDAWLRVDGGGWFKCYSNEGTGKTKQWIWGTNFEINGAHLAPEIPLGAGAHALELSGRSLGFMIDRLHLALPGNPDAKDKTAPVSPCAVEDAGTYCVAKPNSQGCTPALTVPPGQPSASAGSGWSVIARFLINGQPGLFLYGDVAASIPFQGGSLCVRPPFQRTAYQNTGGSGAPGGNCTGKLALDVNALIAGSGSDPLLTAGAPLYLQAWHRDLNDAFDTGLSNAAAMLIQR